MTVFAGPGILPGANLRTRCHQWSAGSMAGRGETSSAIYGSAALSFSVPARNTVL